MSYFSTLHYALKHSTKHENILKDSPLFGHISGLVWCIKNHRYQQIPIRSANQVSASIWIYNDPTLGISTTTTPDCF